MLIPLQSGCYKASSMGLAEYAQSNTMLDRKVLLEKFSDADVKSLLDDIAKLYLGAQDRTFLAELVKFLRRFLPVKQTSVFEFRRGLQPQVLHVEGSGFDQDLRKYLNGLYLLDPSYSMYETRSATGAYLVNLKKPGIVRS